MQKKILIGLMSVLFCLNQSSAFAANECIALTNDSPVAVEFDSLVSPGAGYIVQPKASATLSRDHMVGACLGSGSSQNCVVTVAYVDHSGYSIISNLPRGTRIIYHGTNQYDLDKNAHVPCK